MVGGAARGSQVAAVPDHARPMALQARVSWRPMPRAGSQRSADCRPPLWEGGGDDQGGGTGWGGADPAGLCSGQIPSTSGSAAKATSAGAVSNGWCTPHSEHRKYWQ